MSKKTQSPAASFARHFLIAMPSLEDDNFAGTVTYICEHNDNGAMGIIINRPQGLTLRELYDQLDLPTGIIDAGQPVLAGGPVSEERGFVVHRSGKPWGSTWKVSDDVSLTSSQDVLQAMSRGEGPRDAFIVLGYAGWGPGQLEEEISANSWLIVEADADIIFDTPVDQRWAAATRLLGFDPAKLSGQAGRA